MKEELKLSWQSISFTHMASEEFYDNIKKIWGEKFDELCEKHSIFKDLTFFEFDDLKRWVRIHPPENWMKNELFLLFIFQNDGYTLSDDTYKVSLKTGFKDVSLSNISDSEKKDLFRFTNEILKISEYTLESYWYLEDDEGTFECENQVSYNPDGEFPYSSYDEEYVSND